MEDETTPSPILRTKLNRPPVPSDHVHRTRLLDELEKGRERPLTLISAPAGYGKSTLASCWLAASDFPGAWLSLDERDNDLRLFLTYFLEAIRTLFPTALQETVALLKAGSLPPVSVLAASLLNELEGVEQEFILVLDDFHRIQNPSVLDLLAEVLRYPAEPMHLVLAGRRDPFLPMSNLRARGLVTEIRAQGLRFTTQETEAFLHGALSDRVEEATAAAWAEKTEGWVTGLRLAALSLCHQADAGAKMLETVGSSRYLTEYFYEEVLARQTTDVRQHLLRSSILDRFCAPLCDALYEAGIEPGPPDKPLGKGRFLGVLTLALKPFAQVTGNTGIGEVCIHGKLGFALPAKVLFSRLHRAVAGRDCHGTDIDARATHLAEIRTGGKGEIDASILSATDKSDRLGLPDFSANTDAAATEDAVLVTERVTNVLDPAPECNILYGSGVGRFCNQEFRHILPQGPDPVRVRANHHAFLDLQCAGGGDLRPAVAYELDDAQPTRSDVREGGDMAQMRDTDAVFHSDIQYRYTLWCPQLCAVHIHRNVM